MTKKAVLDTNFIISCLENKIDFFEELKLKGYKILIPIQVIHELEKFSKSSKKLKEKTNAELALKIIKLNKPEQIVLTNNYVDKGIIDFTKANPEVHVATLDRGIKTKVRNNKIVIREKSRLEII